jgi:hypothetical protein
LENNFHSILDVINKLEAQRQGEGGFALKTKKLIGFDNLRVGIVGYTKGCLQGINS